MYKNLLQPDVEQVWSMDDKKFRCLLRNRQVVCCTCLNWCAWRLDFLKLDAGVNAPVHQSATASFHPKHTENRQWRIYTAAIVVFNS